MQKNQLCKYIPSSKFQNVLTSHICMLITIFAYMKNSFPRHSARTVGSPTRSLSPYAYCAYCANNPVNNVDLDGKKKRFAKGVPSEFK